MGVGVKCDGVDLRHINFSIYHNALIGSDIDHLTDDAASVFIVLILDEPALQADRELVDDRGIYCFCFAGCQTAAGKFIGNFIAGLYTEIVCFHYVGSIGNADGECSPCLDVLYGLGGIYAFGTRKNADDCAESALCLGRGESTDRVITSSLEN